MFSSIDTSISKENKGSNISIPSLKGNGDDYVHRLVQDENAKTILLNVPLEINSTLSGKFCTLCSPDKWLNKFTKLKI